MSTNMTSSVPFSLRLAPDLKSRLETEAKNADRSASYMATHAIKMFLDAQDSKRRAIELAIIEADKGEFISSEAMGNWVKSWGSDNELSKPVADIKAT